MEKKKGRKMRLENGFGSVVYLGDGRRCPYGARTATAGYDEKGNAQGRKYIGYFKTWDEAHQALMEYNKDPYRMDLSKITFGELSKLLIQRKEEEKIKYLTSLKSYLKKCDELNDIPIKSLKSIHLQKWFNSISGEYKYKYLQQIVKAVHLVFEIAVELDVIRKNDADYIRILKDNDAVSGIPFIQSEIDKLWANVDKVEGADMILVMIYSGFRVLAYNDMKINYEQGYFCGGVKTDAGRDRIVPIHHRILPLVKKLEEEKRLFGCKPHKIRRAMRDILIQCDIDPGEFPYNKTPHDCRHTFNTRLLDAKVAPALVDKLVGHSNKSLTEGLYYTPEYAALKEAIETLK